MAKVRIKLNSTDIETLNNICESIKDIAKKSGIAISGPVPLPTKKLKIKQENLLVGMAQQHSTGLK